MPQTKPSRPKRALRSPPARRRIMRNGQPMNIRQPIITKKPSTNRVRGELPPRGENSLRSSAMRKLPSTSPRISGRIYCTAPAVCSPSAPEMSRRKQAMQKPMFTGFPNSTSSEAMTPMAMPASTMPVFSRCFIIKFLSFSPWNECPHYTTGEGRLPIAFIDAADAFIEISNKFLARQRRLWYASQKARGERHA